jgi:probable HAF family extracellular repeat protein
MKTPKLKNTLAGENPVWLVLCVLVLTSAAIAQPPTYVITDLGTLGGETSRALSLNDQGQITGASLNGETSTTKVCTYWDSKTPICSWITVVHEHPFLWTPHTPNGTTGTMTDIGTLGGPYGLGTAINNAGQIAGHSVTQGDSSSKHRPFRWLPNSSKPMTDLSKSGLENLDSFEADPAGIGPNGEVISKHQLWLDGEVTDLGNLLGDPDPIARVYVSATGINSSGQVVGNDWWNGSSPALFGPRAFLWQKGVMTNLGALPGDDFGEVYAISDNGLVAGTSFVELDLGWTIFIVPDRGFLLTLGPEGQVRSRLALPSLENETELRPRSVNNAGTVIGVYQSQAEPGGSPYSRIISGFFVWDRRNGQRDLPSLLPPGSGWQIKDVYEINNAGQIVGTGINPEGRQRGFLLTPTALPTLHISRDGNDVVVQWIQGLPNVVLESCNDPNPAASWSTVMDASGRSPGQAVQYRTPLAQAGTLCFRLKSVPKPM